MLLPGPKQVSNSKRKWISGHPAGGSSRVTRKNKVQLPNSARSETLIVWGGGGFGPTSKAHDSAPNKKLQMALAREIPLIVSTEYRSSKTSCCHHCPVTELKSKGQRTRSVVVQCCACSTLLGRDLNAANVIADIFNEDSCNLPLWITDDTVRETNQSLYRLSIYTTFPSRG